MKNTFAVSMTVLLALTLAGGVFGYRLATAEEKPAAAETPGPSPKDVTPATPGPSASNGAAANGDASAPSSKGATQASTSAATTASSTAAAGTASGNTTTAATTATSPAASSGDSAKGKAVFATAGCAGCHGANGGGGIGPNLGMANGPKSWTLDQFHTALRTGHSPVGMLKAPMPQFAPTTVSDADVANIYAYIKTLN
ncbi:c-type cytochrome [Deinococcus sp.]|uniref:c-type cytochrome n=1 Tax=Deinococcus sp. TaxID=47478 RepID=UPI003CC61A1E